MIITWKIGYSDNLADVSNSELANQVMPIFGLDQDEYEIHEGYVEATPTVLTISKWISGVRFSVYDIRLENRIETKTIFIRIRLFKLFIVPLIFPAIGLITGFDYISLGLSFIVYGLCILFFGLMTLIELAVNKSRIRKKINTLANNT
jgi:hypothetical protein